MTSTMTSNSTEQVVKKHPIRGALWGLLLGLSLMVYSILFAIVDFTDWIPMLFVVIVGVAIGVAWAYLAPAKQPKGDSPAATDDDTYSADLDEDDKSTRPLEPSPISGTVPDDDSASDGGDDGGD